MVTELKDTQFASLDEAYEHYINLYGKKNIPEEILEYWTFANKDIMDKRVRDGGNNENQYKLISNGKGTVEQMNAVLRKYDWPQAIKLGNKRERDHGHITWKVYTERLNNKVTLAQLSMSQGGATFLHPARVDDKPPSENYIRTPGGGWAPRADPVTPGYDKDIPDQFIIDGHAFPVTLDTFWCTIM